MKRVVWFGIGALFLGATLVILLPNGRLVGSANRAPADAAMHQESEAPSADLTYGGQPAPSAPLTQEEQQNLIDAKAEAARVAGVDYQPDLPVTVAEDQPAKNSVEKVNVTRQELLEAFNASLKALEEQLAEVEARHGPEAADAIRQQITGDTIRQIDAIPLEGITIEIPAVEVGHGSINFSRYSYSQLDPQVASDPANVIFGGPQGSAWDANYGLKNWTSLRWECDTCDPPPWLPGFLCQGSTQWMYVWDAQHGGSDSWRAQSYGLQPLQDHCTQSPRFHIRLFNGGYDNHSGGFREYSLGTAHWEDGGHTPIGWEAAEVLTQFSFRNLDTGGLLWFVSNIYYGQLYTGEWWRGHLNDGWATFVILAQ